MTPRNDSHSNEWVKSKFVDNQYPPDTPPQEVEKNDRILSHSSGLEIDTVKGWSSVYSRIKLSSKTANKSSNKRYLIPLAAAVTLLIVSGLAVFNFVENTTSEKIYQSGFTKEIILLEDGSKVTLNSESKLTVDKNFNLQTRILSLEGEAIFSVKKTKNNKSFVVKTKHGQVTVLGTEFNVNTELQTQVYVKHGQVALTNDQDGNKIQLQKGDLGILDTEGKLIKKQGDSNILFWETNILSFNSEKLIDIVEEVNLRLDSKILLDKDIQDRKFTLSFEGSEISDFFDELNKINDFKITQVGDSFRISTKKL